MARRLAGYGTLEVILHLGKRRGVGTSHVPMRDRLDRQIPTQEWPPAKKRGEREG